MYSFPEEPFTINGVKSWIHCLDCFARQSEVHEEGPMKYYHYHEYIEFLYALDADMVVWLNGDPHHMLSGDLIIINSEELHNIAFNKDSHYICVKFSPKILYFDDDSLIKFKYVTPFLSDISPQKLFHENELNDVDVHRLSLEIMEEWRLQKPAYELSIRANIQKIFTGVIRYWNDQNVFHSKAMMTEAIKKALLYISDNLESATARNTAAVCNLSYNHFSTVFKKTVGRSFIDYITLLRLNEAEKLLISTQKSITEIALSCGFSSTSHFIARFRAQKGITPGQLRKKIR